MNHDDMEPCEALDCQRPRHPGHLLCFFHFSELQFNMKTRLCRARAMYPSTREYFAACDEAIRFLARKEGKEGDNKYSRKVREIDSGRHTIVKHPKGTL